MNDSFQPLDLTGLCNAGTGNIDLGGRWLWPHSGDDPHATPLDGLPAGECLFLGVPFQLAEADAERRFVVAAAAGEAAESRVVIPVGARARRLLFAHACAPEGGEWATLEGAGEALGRYVVRFADGSESAQPLRRRWEIHDINAPWGHHPFLCRNGRHFDSVGLHEPAVGYGGAQVGVYSRFDRADGRPAGGPGAMGGDLTAWWLFDLAVDRTEAEIAEVVLEAATPTPLVLGAVTLCNEQEDPFHWEARRTVAVTVEGGEEAPEVSVDRGVVARQDDLFVPDGDFLTTDETGWAAADSRSAREARSRSTARRWPTWR